MDHREGGGGLDGLGAAHGVDFVAGEIRRRYLLFVYFFDTRVISGENLKSTRVISGENLKSIFGCVFFSRS
jgi:hypothetical protein